MMKICDKCGTSKRTAVGYKGKRLITVNIREGFPKRNVYTYKRYELCVKCWKKYDKYLKRFFKKEKLRTPPITKEIMGTLLSIISQNQIGTAKVKK